MVLKVGVSSLGLGGYLQPPSIGSVQKQGCEGGWFGVSQPQNVSTGLGSKDLRKEGKMYLS